MLFEVSKFISRGGEDTSFAREGQRVVYDKHKGTYVMAQEGDKERPESVQKINYYLIGFLRSTRGRTW